MKSARKQPGSRRLSRKCSLVVGQTLQIQVQGIKKSLEKNKRFIDPRQIPFRFSSGQRQLCVQRNPVYRTKKLLCPFEAVSPFPCVAHIMNRMKVFDSLEVTGFLLRLRNEVFVSTFHRQGQSHCLDRKSV